MTQAFGLKENINIIVLNIIEQVLLIFRFDNATS